MSRLPRSILRRIPANDRRALLAIAKMGCFVVTDSEYAAQSFGNLYLDMHAESFGLRYTIDRGESGVFIFIDGSMHLASDLLRAALLVPDASVLSAGEELKLIHDNLARLKDCLRGDQKQSTLGRIIEFQAERGRQWGQCGGDH